MKLIICIVQDQDSNDLIEELTASNYRITKLASTGGFLKSGNTTLLIGVETSKLDDVIKIIEENCKTRSLNTSLINMNVPGDAYIPFPLEVKVGGATIFVIDVIEHIKF